MHDPHYFWHAGQRLEDEGIPMLEWQWQRMAAATRTLHEAVAHGRVRHGGDETARRHALAAEVREREYGLTISKRASRDAIDCLVARLRRPRPHCLRHRPQRAGGGLAADREARSAKRRLGRRSALAPAAPTVADGPMTGAPGASAGVRRRVAMPWAC